LGTKHPSNTIGLAFCWLVHKLKVKKRNGNERIAKKGQEKRPWSIEEEKCPKNNILAASLQIYANIEP